MRGCSQSLTRKKRPENFSRRSRWAGPTTKSTCAARRSSAPYIQAVREPAGQFLLAGVFPNTPRSKPLPPELFQRLAAKDLVFITGKSPPNGWPQVLNLSQLGLVLTSHRQLDGNSAALKWIQKIAPKLGNTVTEITQTGPAEMTFTRKAPGAFTAVELFHARKLAGGAGLSRL